MSVPSRLKPRTHSRVLGSSGRPLCPGYSLAETAVEKALALADRARNEPRDLYDLWHLVCREGIQLSELAPAIAAKLAFRRQEPAGIQDAIIRKERRLKALWSTRLANRMVALPPFDEVFRNPPQVAAIQSPVSRPPSPGAGTTQLITASRQSPDQLRMAGTPLGSGAADPPCRPGREVGDSPMLSSTTRRASTVLVPILRSSAKV